MEEANRLTERERQCLRLVHSHFNSKQIARELGIKPGTVDRHCENATRKLQAENRVDAALRLVAVEIGIGNDSQSERLPIENPVLEALDQRAERTAHDTHLRHPTPRQLGRNGSHAAAYGDYRSEAFDGPSFDGGNTQADALPHSGRGDVGDHLHRGSHVGRTLQSDLAGPSRLGSILLVFGVAAVVAWILTAIAGAEQFAMILQRVKHGG